MNSFDKIRVVMIAKFSKLLGQVKRLFTRTNSRQYFYRVDPRCSIPSIRKEGFRCGPATRLNVGNGVPVETADAILQGFPGPPPEIMLAPRIYFFTSEQEAGKSPLIQSSLLLRFDSSPPRFSLGSEPFYDGSVPTGGGRYICFANAACGDIVISPRAIEVRVGDQWVPIRQYVKRSWWSGIRRDRKS
jgi:hypothetical protein